MIEELQERLAKMKIEVANIGEGLRAHRSEVEKLIVDDISKRARVDELDRTITLLQESYSA